MGASRLIIDLQALTANYRYLDQYSSLTTRTGAAVKADAYGLGLGPVSSALYDSGCRQFFVAQLSEAVALRHVLQQPDCQIFVLEGPQRRELPDYQASNLTPVLNTTEQIETILAFNQTARAQLRPAVHLDTAMNRLGLNISEIDALMSAMQDKGLDVCLLMSHLACADEQEHELNKAQLDAFTRLSAAFPDTPKSLSNSAGILLGNPFHFDLTRPGISVYGAMADPSAVHEALRPVFRWQADILQIRTIDVGESVGYGAEFTATKRTRLATIGAGYADGYARSLYRPEAGRIAVAGIGGYAAPLAGRVSMDLSVVDVSDIPDAVLETTESAELIWDGFRLEEMAHARDTIAYEVMTGLGGRVKRQYDEPTSGAKADARRTTHKIKA